MLKALEIIPNIKKADGTATAIEEVGTETTGIKGVNKSYKVTLSDGTVWLFKPMEEEHISKWRYVPPHTQFKREKAAYLVDDQLGFGMMPETKIVELDGKIGSLQKWVETGRNIEDDPDMFVEQLNDDETWKAAIEDALIGNIDRHSGNILIEDSRIWLIDHGFSFPSRAENHDNKSVILSRFVAKVWGKEIPRQYMSAMQRLKTQDFMDSIKRLLDEEAYDLFKNRLRHLLRTGTVKFPGYKIRRKVTETPK